MKKPTQSKPRLLALNNENNQPPIFLESDEGDAFTFGRSPVCDLPIKDIAVSRQHCRIVRHGKNFHIEDLSSHNGTFVNDVPVKSQTLEHGDCIRVGSAYFMFLISDADDAPLLLARFDDGALVANSTVRLFPVAGVAELSADLNILVKLGKAINDLQREPEKLQRAILETILEFIPARRAAIVSAASGDFEDLQAVCVAAQNYKNTEPMQISRTVARQVLEDQAALLSNDLLDKNADAADSLISARVSSVLCVPLKIGERKGLIYLDADDRKIRFLNAHLEQLTAISYLISAALGNAESINSLREENQALKDTLHIETNMVGESKAFKQVVQMVGKVAATDSTVLITGETGTGKELIARAIHQNSARRKKPFVAINCAALNENLLESELFGHERGAFTGAFAQKAGKLEIADGGTIFLDEIGDLAAQIQIKLLRVLQEREFERVGGTKTLRVNVRVIAATNRNLELEVEEKRFRQDLFFRLNVVPIHVPPLRERISDIPLLARHFVRKYSELCHRKVVGLSDRAEQILLKNSWAGNVRELENAVERAIVLGTGNEIRPEDLPSAIFDDHHRAEGDYNEQLKQAKRKIVMTAFQKSNGNFTDTAALLSIHRNNLHRLVRELGIKDELRTER